MNHEHECLSTKELALLKETEEKLKVITDKLEYMIRMRIELQHFMETFPQDVVTGLAMNQYI
jgi:hypothetical protein